MLRIPSFCDHFQLRNSPAFALQVSVLRTVGMKGRNVWASCFGQCFPGLDVSLVLGQRPPHRQEGLGLPALSCSQLPRMQSPLRLVDI
jgi:hypothetical protein